MTWKPSAGLEYAVSILKTIDEAAHITRTKGYEQADWSPAFNHRAVEIIANTIDQAINAARIVKYEDKGAIDVHTGEWELPNGPDPQPDGATMMGGHPSSEYHSIIDEERAITKDIRAKIAAKVAAEMPKKTKPRRKKAKTKKAAKSASEKHSGDNPPTGD